MIANKILHLFLRKESFFYVFLIIFFVGISKLLLREAASFGCFDDCFNYGAGYFILKGKSLYSEIFFNHQMLMAYISALVQFIFSPRTIFELLLAHRYVLIFFGFIMNVFLLWRFGKIALVFTIIYESTKYYFFGDRFLAEGFIVYPLVYMAGAVFYKTAGKKILFFEPSLFAFFAWFVIFMREPFTPLALVLFFLFIFQKKMGSRQVIPLIILICLSAITVGLAPIKEYFFNIFTANASTVIAGEAREQGSMLTWFFTIFLYPLYIFISGEWNSIKLLLASLSASFIVVSAVFLYKKHYKIIFIAILLLGLANIRVVTPGTTFYAAFHMLPWYGMFIFLTLLLMQWSTPFKLDTRVTKILFVIIFLALFNIFTFKSSYIDKRSDRSVEFVTNYGSILSNGEVIKLLANKNSTLFLDGWDELLYFQTQLTSTYKYSWYTSIMPRFNKYQDARVAMFEKSPPDFYYGGCGSGVGFYLPDFLSKKYTQFYFAGNPTCLYIKNETLALIPAEKLNKINQYEFYILK